MSPGAFDHLRLTDFERSRPICSPEKDARSSQADVIYRRLHAIRHAVATIYRIISRADWTAAQPAGTFAGAAHDIRDGFIHFSTARQAAETAAKHYAGQSDLLLLYVDTDALAAPLKWEVSRGGDLFPHLYGALSITAVRRVVDLPLGADGRHVFPELE